jgi:hypothetical protein
MAVVQFWVVERDGVCPSCKGEKVHIFDGGGGFKHSVRCDECVGTGVAPVPTMEVMLTTPAIDIRF